MSLEIDLGKFGLSKTESRVYISLLSLEGAYVSTVAQRSNTERTNCYHTLKTLAKRGLVSVTNRGSYKYYIAETPKKFIYEQEDKLHLAKKMVPDLLSLRQSGLSIMPKMKYYEGKEGVKTLLRQCLDTKTELLSYTNIKLLKDKFGSLLQEYCDGKVRKKVKSKIISPYHKETESFLEESFPKDYIYTSIQLLYINPKEFFLENDITIFDDKVSIISLNPDENIGVIIESQVYADTSRATFSLSWLGATTFVAK